MQLALLYSGAQDSFARSAVWEATGHLQNMPPVSFLVCEAQPRLHQARRAVPHTTLQRASGQAPENAGQATCSAGEDGS